MIWRNSTLQKTEQESTLEYAVRSFKRARSRNGGYMSSIAAADALSEHGLLGLHNIDADAPSMFKSATASVLEASFRGGDFSGAFKAGLQFIAAPFHACFVDDLGLELVSMIEDADSEGDTDSKRLYAEWLVWVRSWIAFRYPNSSLGADSTSSLMFANDLELKASGEIERMRFDAYSNDRQVIRI